MKNYQEIKELGTGYKIAFWLIVSPSFILHLFELMFLVFCLSSLFNSSYDFATNLIYLLATYGLNVMYLSLVAAIGNWIAKTLTK